MENVFAKAEEMGARNAPCKEPIWIDLKEDEVLTNG